MAAKTEMVKLSPSVTPHRGQLSRLALLCLASRVPDLPCSEHPWDLIPPDTPQYHPRYPGWVTPELSED